MAIERNGSPLVNEAETPNGKAREPLQQAGYPQLGINHAAFGGMSPPDWALQWASMSSA